ncbi:hypothetical protein DSL72_006413 [Monilinia vaccinii-corymbosi]|uniref:Uncharacterized protein n=1 Tax=Monilinia vaccinii-corymbosi TaxID=61207 RepID=A0A8A3PNE9_9HELO|nr:hypothetical protein DSL72_006413 [Monilinia vaccinii-corymbosi]
MESQGNNQPSGSQTGTPTKITPSTSSKENSVARLNRQSSIRTTERPPSLHLTSQEFETFYQQVGDISLEEAKDHLQNLGPVPTMPDPTEVNNRKLLEQEEIKTIRRDAVNFLKRRTAERLAKLANPTLTVTNENNTTSPIPSTTHAESAAPVEMAQSTLGSTSAFSSGATRSIEGQTYQPRRPVATYAGPDTRQFSPSTSGVARPLGSSGFNAAPVTTSGWVSNPYASNYGAPPASAAAGAMGLPIPPVVPSQNQPVSLEWLYGAPVRSPLVSANVSRQTTPDLVYSSDGSEDDSGKRKANSPAADRKLEHNKFKSDVRGPGRGAGGAGGSAPQQ